MEKLEGSCSDIYVGSLISLTSKSEIRYEGVLFTLDTEKFTIVLKDVRSFGTEGRGTNILQIPSNRMVYEYIIFRNTDIKDLSVVSFQCTADKPVLEEINNQEKVQKQSSGCTLDICLGWPVSTQSPQMQEGANWWQWLCSSAASGSYGVPPNALLSTFPNNENKITPISSWSSFMQENYDASVTNSQAKLSIFEQVPTLISSTQNFALAQHLSGHVSVSGRGFLTGHENFQPKSSPQRDEFHFRSSQVQPLRQQPLLPLPVSESEHRRLIKESKSPASLGHTRRTRAGSRGGPHGAFSGREASSNTCSEASSLIRDVSKDFDFGAMNKQFNKKELWNNLELNEMHLNEKQEDCSQTILNTNTTSCGLPRKAHFVDGFFDLMPTEDESCKQIRSKGSKFQKQRQIDAETFGVSSVPGNESRSGIHRRALCGGKHSFGSPK